MSEIKNITGSEALIRSVIAEGGEFIFGYPGGAIMPVYDTLYDFQDQIKHILVRHEQGAGHAAQGYARASGKVGLAMATSGPGATNLVTAIADAQIDSTPIVCITGQVPETLLGTDAFQETNIIGISMPVTKWSYQITDVNEIPEIVAKAFYIARTGRPGPVLIDIAKNAQLATLENYEHKPFTGVRSYKPKPIASKQSLADAAEIINKAKRPMILAGQGIILSNAEKELKELAVKADIPVTCTLLGLSCIPIEDEYYRGYLGMHGNYAPNVLTNEADVLIAIGMRFDDRVTGNLDYYAKNAKIVHLEIDPSEIDKIVHADAAVIGDAKESLQALIPMLNENKHPKWFARFDELDKIEYEKVIKDDMYPETDGLHMSETIRRISEKTKGEAIIVTDVGQHQMIAHRYYNFKHPRTSITSGGLGTMGFCLPAAFGAKMGAPHRQVISISGDGGFQMNLQELGTIFQTKADIKILILNNNFLGMVRQWQELFFDKRYASTEMINPNFIKLAEAYDIPSNQVSKREDIDAALDEFLNHKGSYLLEVKVVKEGNVFPMIPSGESVSNIRLS
jgi:acetolactate synthase-1/2/3 large subunit